MRKATIENVFDTISKYSAAVNDMVAKIKDSDIGDDIATKIKHRDFTRTAADDRSGVSGALILGLVIGAVGALLLAPKAGTETRQDLMNKIKDTSDEIKNKSPKNVRDLVE
ncbi:MAG: YtxH domain-containing protein [Bacteroidota bacterium]|nr:YtxH domain-containing protein [Bacteroidota bacterium]